jgi:hypothetical protein
LKKKGETREKSEVRIRTFAPLQVAWSSEGTRKGKIKGEGGERR